MNAKYFNQLANPSATAKAYASALVAMLSAVAGMFADQPVGKAAAILVAGLTALFGVYSIKNVDAPQDPKPDS